MKTTCKKSWPVNPTSDILWILYNSYNLSFFHMIFPNLNVVEHLVLPAGWGSCLPMLAIFKILC